MSLVFGVVCEGPTDFVTIKSIVDLITKEEVECRRLYPDEPPVGQFGNGWKGVWRWCESHATILGDYLTKVTPKIDCLIVHMDGDVSRREREVHCTCASAVCEQSGTIHPLFCSICKSGKCPAVLPCANHDDDGYAEHLRGLILSWLCISEDESPLVVVTIPCDSIDTWVAAAYGDLTEKCESHHDPWNSIIAHGAYYHSIRIQGHKKRASVYRELSDRVTCNWASVKRLCPQAQIFESEILGKLPGASI